MQRLRARSRAGRTVIVALHDVGLALRFADEVVAVKDGGILWARPVGAVDAAALAALYDVEVRLTHDGDGPAVRFIG